MSQPVGQVVTVDATSGEVRYRDPTPAEVADITQLRATEVSQRQQQDARSTKLSGARRKIAQAMAAGQGARVITVADLAELLGIDASST